MPLIDRQQQCAADSDVVEWLARRVGRDQVAAIPVTGLHRDLIMQFAGQFIACRGRQAAELDRRAVGADRVHPHRLFRREQTLEPMSR